MTEKPIKLNPALVGIAQDKNLLGDPSALPVQIRREIDREKNLNPGSPKLEFNEDKINAILDESRQGSKRRRKNSQRPPKTQGQE